MYSFLGKIKGFINRHRVITNAVLVTLLVVAAVIISAPATAMVFSAASSTSRKLPIYCVETDEKKVAVSFDAAWGADDTDRLLQILDDHDVKATFFLCGYWVDKYPEEVKKIYEAGHDIGNHGDSHAHGAQLNLEQNQREILNVHKKVMALIGSEMNLFRPPYGEYNNTVIEAANSLGYYTVQWDVDSLDWKEYGVEKEVSQVLDHKHLGNGSIILFHNDAKFTPDALGIILKGLKDKGYDIVPISELIHKENYYMDHEGRQILKDN